MEVRNIKMIKLQVVCLETLKLTRAKHKSKGELYLGIVRNVKKKFVQKRQILNLEF